MLGAVSRRRPFRAFVEHSPSAVCLLFTPIQLRWKHGDAWYIADSKQPIVPTTPPRPFQVRWEQLTTVEFMVNGSRCTIYTAFYGTTPVVVKVMRKDVQDRETVRQVRVTSAVLCFVCPNRGLNCRACFVM